MLHPNRTKYRKKQKGKQTGLSKSGCFIEFGEFGIQMLDRGLVTSRQIESMRVAINRYLSRKGKVWIRIFPDKPTTKKPAETRMGKGKGSTDQWVAVVRPGRILFELGEVPRADAQQALRRAAVKIGLRTRLVERVEKV
jgi:large subunit ribosomal protein L16